MRRNIWLHHRNDGAYSGWPEVPKGDQVICILKGVINMQVAFLGQEYGLKKVY